MSKQGGNTWWARTETKIPANKKKEKTRLVVTLMCDQSPYFELSGPTALRSISEMAEKLNLEKALPPPKRLPKTRADGALKSTEKGEDLFRGRQGYRPPEYEFHTL